MAGFYLTISSRWVARRPVAHTEPRLLSWQSNLPHGHNFYDNTGPCIPGQLMILLWTRESSGFRLCRQDCEVLHADRTPTHTNAYTSYHGGSDRIVFPRARLCRCCRFNGAIRVSGPAICHPIWTL